MITRVLIVDDSSVSRKLVQRCMEFAGLAGRTFVEAENGEKALKLLEAGGIDLLITDFHMPVMDGLELLRAMSEIPSLAALPTILMTSVASNRLRTDLERFPHVVLVAKPINPSVLAKTLAPLLGTSEP